MNKVKVGVIGTGHLGKLHTKFLKITEGCELVGVYDMNHEKAKTVAAEFNTNAFESIDELIACCDALSVVASTSAHHELVKKCFASNKHVLVEKPITAKIEEADELVRISNEKNLILQVGHVERFNPAIVALDSYELDPKFIQTDRLAQFNPRGTDVAVVLDLMIHDIDIILSLVKSDVKEIHASGVRVVSDSIDIANARIEFENGAVANVTASRISQKKMRKMRMFQKDAYISVDFGAGLAEVFRLESPSEAGNLQAVFFGEIGIGEKKKMVLYEQPPIPEINALEHEIKLFIKAVANNEKPIVSGLDGLKALKVAESIIKKIEENKIL